MSNEKKEENGKVKKKTGKLKKALMVIMGVFVIFVLIGVFSDTEPEQQSNSNDDSRQAEENKTEIGEGAEQESKEEIRKETNKETTEETITGEKENKEEENNKEDTDNEEIFLADEELPAICSISAYPFQDMENGKKIVALYQKAVEAEREEFICLTEEEDVHMFQNKEVWYQKSLDTTSAPFCYYGEVNQDGKPNGMGMIVRNWEEWYRDGMPGWMGWFLLEEGYDGEEEQEICVEIVYIGEFQDGFKEGYGINFAAEGLYEIPVIAYEGEFVHGKPDGTGKEYLGLAGDTYDDTFEKKLLEEYCVEYSDTVENLLLFPTVVKANLWYEGSYREGGHEGEGKEYWTWGQELRLKYEGEFQNSSYHGTGTLYFEDGTIQYQGEFRNGKYDGKGILYDEQGNVQHEGKFQKGEIQ